METLVTASVDLSIALGIFGLLFAGLEAGFRLGRRASLDQDAAASSQIGAIQGAILGMLGLLLAFSFSAAGARFLERQDLIVQEANAIGTAWLRADLLDEPQRSELRDALKRYTQHRIGVTAGGLRAGVSAAVLAEVDRLQDEIWKSAVAGVTARPGSTLAVLAPVNDVIDLHSIRIAAGGKHIPWLVLGLLIACSSLALAVIGYGCGVGGRRRAPLTFSLAVLIGTALWITIDLDHPRAGMIQLSDAPLAALRFGAPPAP
jgi:hypothetical protein